MTIQGVVEISKAKCLHAQVIREFDKNTWLCTECKETFVLVRPKDLSKISTMYLLDREEHIACDCCRGSEEWINCKCKKHWSEY